VKRQADLGTGFNPNSRIVVHNSLY